jgi:hypothetical protein
LLLKERMVNDDRKYICNLFVFSVLYSLIGIILKEALKK